MNFPSLNKYSFFGENRFVVDVSDKVDNDKGLVRLNISSNYDDLPSNIKDVSHLLTNIICPLTYKSICTDEKVIDLDMSDYLGNIIVECQLVAKQDALIEISTCLDDFYNDEYHLYRGQYLTSTDKSIFYIDIEYLESDSLVDIQHDKYQKKPLKVSFNDVITIKTHHWYVYQQLSKLLARNNELAFSLLPSLAIYAALSSINDVHEVSTYRWFNTIKNQLGWDDDDFEKNLDPVTLLELVHNELGFHDQLLRGLTKMNDEN